MKSLDEIKSEYPLHWQIWNGNVEELQQQLQAEQVCQLVGGWSCTCPWWGRCGCTPEQAATMPNVVCVCVFRLSFCVRIALLTN